MGSILTALQSGKPILVMPRSASLGEHRNDHQLQTAKHFQQQGRIRVAFDEAELERQLDGIATFQPSVRIASLASPALIDALRGFARGAAARPPARSHRRVAPALTASAAAARVATGIPVPSPAIDTRADWTTGLAHQHGAIPAGRLSRLRALVLLSGVVRAKGWISDIDRSALDLPIDSSRSLLAQWFEHAVQLATVPGVQRLAMEVLVDRSSPMPKSDGVLAGLPGSGLEALRVERDPADYRGTGGVLRDLSMRYDDDDYLLVATGAQILMRPLEEMVIVLASRSPDVAVVGHDDGTPAGLMWVRCGCLGMLSEMGFVDLKEQALPQIARRHQVEVVRLPPVGTPLRTPAEYLRAIRQYHLRKWNDERLVNPFAEDWCPTFALVEDGADVDASAELHDSVVLEGGRVEPGAVVVRSVVGPKGVVRRGRHVVQQLVLGWGETGAENC
jgi:mannose-1-phosphate guanylyltransferase